MRRRSMIVILLTALCAGLSASPASANFHLMKIVYVLPGLTDAGGTIGGPFADGEKAEGVVLQMYSSGQHLVGGHSVTFHSATGLTTGTAEFTSSVEGDDNQATILIGTSRFSQLFAMTPDLVLEDADRLSPIGGAVCFDEVDCVSWGTFGAFSPPPAPSPTGTPFPGPILDPQAIWRHISSHCPTTLDAEDDSDDSATDFSLTPDPGYNPLRPNTAPPAEEPCPDTRITSGPQGRTTDRTPTFKFRSPGHPAATFTCRIDTGATVPCDSPMTTKRLKLGKHRLAVRASDGTQDPTPAKRSFTVVRKRR